MFGLGFGLCGCLDVGPCGAVHAVCHSETQHPLVPIAAALALDGGYLFRVRVTESGLPMGCTAITAGSWS